MPSVSWGEALPTISAAPESGGARHRAIFRLGGGVLQSGLSIQPRVSRKTPCENQQAACAARRPHRLLWRIENKETSFRHCLINPISSLRALRRYRRALDWVARTALPEGNGPQIESMRSMRDQNDLQSFFRRQLAASLCQPCLRVRIVRIGLVLPVSV